MDFRVFGILTKNAEHFSFFFFVYPNFLFLYLFLSLLLQIRRRNAQIICNNIIKYIIKHNWVKQNKECYYFGDCPMTPLTA